MGKQLSDKLKQDHTSNHLQHLDQRTKNIFLYKKHQKQSHINNGNYQFKCHQCYENHPHSGKKCCKRFKILTRGSFFDPESQKAFLDKHQQKNTPKITTCSTWSSMNSNSKTSEK